MRIVWNEAESSNGVGGNATLLKSLSVLVETEEDEICDEAETNAATKCEAAENEQTNETAPIDNNGENDGNDNIDSGENENSPSGEVAEDHEEDNNTQKEDAAIEVNSSETKKTNVVKMKIPPIWTPVDRRTNSAMIYLYFRTVRKWQLREMPN